MLVSGDSQLLWPCLSILLPGYIRRIFAAAAVVVVYMCRGIFRCSGDNGDSCAALVLCSTELCAVRKGTGTKHYTLCGVRSRFRAHYWRNYLPLISAAVEFVQLLSLAESRTSRCVL